MEPTLIKNNKIFNNQKKVIVTLIIFLVCLFIETSYSILTSNDETEEVITFQAGELNLEVKTNTDTSVNFPDELPKSEEEVEKPIILNIKNTGSLTICEYRLKLVPDTTPVSDLKANYIRYAISKDNGVSYNESKLLSETNNQIFIGFNLKPTETKTIYVKVWLDEEALDNEEILNKHFYGKIEAELLQRCEALATEHLKATIGEIGGIIGVTNDSQKVTSDTENIREYRYSGLGVNNYVTFNNETWRILGVFKDENGNELVKIVRNELLSVDGETNWREWRNSESVGNWDNASLNIYLNEEYLPTLHKSYQNMITETKYYLGALTIYSYENIYGIKETPIEAYEMERAVTGCNENKGPITNNNRDVLEENSTCRVWSNNAATWTGKIALMYPSDLGFSASDSYWKTTKLIDYDETKDMSWLQKEANHVLGAEWLLSSTSFYNGSISSWGAGVGLGYHVDYQNGDYWLGVRPSLYLKSEVKIIGGNGTSTDPYTLQL